jgi:hypothetical protein
MGIPEFQTGVTHENSQAKSKVTVAWEAPPQLSEDVVFTYVFNRNNFKLYINIVSMFSVTTARDGGTFWVAQKATPVKVVRN